MKVVSLCFALLFVACGEASQSDLQNIFSRSNGRYPIKPHDDVTPGTTCRNPSYRRYPEKIAYCERDVQPSLKYDIIRDYDRRFGYKIGNMNRGDFKIDHLIPLCMGGGNERENLWPQHRSVFDNTDIAESTLCEQMSFGRLKQVDAISLIRRIKNDPERTRDYIAAYIR